MLIEARAVLTLNPRGLLRMSDLGRDEVREMLLFGRARVGGGAGPVDSVEASILDHATGKATWTPPATYYLGLSTTTPTDAAGNFTEPVGNNYARVNIAVADWNVASGTAPVTSTNANQISFAAASGSWGTLTYAGLFAAVSGGTHLWFGALTASATVGSGGTVTFAASNLILQLGDPTDTY